MKAIIVSAMIGALALGTAGAAPAADKMMMLPACKGVVMNAVGGSGESGCAVAHAVNGAMVVAISVKGEPPTAIQPSHIHKGVCGSNGPVVVPLTNVVGGKSTTTIPMAKWNMMKGGKYYINIHKSTSDIPTIVSCGNVPPMAMTTKM
jgi:hypothetical protein